MLTLLPEFRPYFTAVPEPFCCCNGSVLTVLVISALYAISRLQVSRDCGVSTHALYLAFSAYLTDAFQFLLCGGISAFTGVAAVQVLHGLCAPGLTWLTTSGMPTLHWGHWEEI